jgi:DNA-damage-inducible protein J
MGTSKTASARALIDPHIKKEAEAILKELGLSVSKSFELYYRQIIAHRGLPFALQVPNEKTMKAIENSRQGKGKTRFIFSRFIDYKVAGDTVFTV